MDVFIKYNDYYELYELIINNKVVMTARDKECINFDKDKYILREIKKQVRNKFNSIKKTILKDIKKYKSNNLVGLFEDGKYERKLFDYLDNINTNFNFDYLKKDKIKREYESKFEEYYKSLFYNNQIGCYCYEKDYLIKNNII